VWHHEGVGGVRLSIALAWICAAGAACGADIGDGAGALVDAAGLLTVSDASPTELTADAAPPCVEGDDRVQDPDSGACYMFFQSALSWSAAQDACVALGAHLVYSNSVGENALFSAIAPATDGLHDIWTGGTDVPTEGTWRWIDGTTYYTTAGGAVTFAHWRSGEPNNGAGGTPENCMIIEGQNNVLGEGCLWDDRDCNTAYPYLCERE
jgi:hypothetical protein